jgi:hypothetical protein
VQQEGGGPYEHEALDKPKGDILDFKQVFQFDSPQIFQILKNFRKMQTRYKIFSKKDVFLDRVLSHAFKLFVLNSQNFHNYGRK